MSYCLHVVMHSYLIDAKYRNLFIPTHYPTSRTIGE